MSDDKFFGRKSGCGCDCCGKRITGFREVKIGSCRVEIVGADDVFQKYFDSEKKPIDTLGDEMIKDLRGQNFVPEDTEDLYKEALIREYQSYCEAKKK